MNRLKKTKSGVFLYCRFSLFLKDLFFQIILSCLDTFFSQCLDTYLFLNRFLPIYIHAIKFHQYLNQFLQHVLLPLYTEGHYVGPFIWVWQLCLFFYFILLFLWSTFFPKYISRIPSASLTVWIHFVASALLPNCLQRLSAVTTIKLPVNTYKSSVLFCGTYAKQRRTRSDATECSIWSGSPQFVYRIFY